MAVGTVVSTAYGVAKTTGVWDSVSSWAGGLLGGGGGGPSKSEDRKEASSVLDKTGDQLASVISLTDRGNLSNSQEAAALVREAIEAGEVQLLPLQNIIDTTLGYGRNSSQEPDSNWPWGEINPLLRQMIQAKKSGGGSPGMQATAMPGSANFGTGWLIGGLLLLGLFGVYQFSD